MAAQGQLYGQSLPDQVERITDFFDAQLQLIGDVREIYRERAALEREYASKLMVLSRKAAEKKAKTEMSIVLGDDPTKAWDANTLRQNTLNVAYDEIMNSIVSTAQDHIDIADALNAQVIDVLAVVGRRSEDVKKKEVQYFEKLLVDRNRVYAERLKSKQKYDEECTAVEEYRQKQGRAQDDRHAERAAKQAEQQRQDMLNSKNTYLIAISIANKAKEKFYNEDLPSLENELQILQTRLIERFSKIVIHCQNLQLKHLDTLKTRIVNLESRFKEVDPRKDQDLFIDNNIRAFAAPLDWKFEPCPIHYDTDEMSTEPAPKVFLQNKLSRSGSKLQELEPLMKTNNAELNDLSRQISTYVPDHILGTIDKITDNYLEAQHQLTFYTTSQYILNAEVEAIVAAIGNDFGSRKPHSFKSSSFSIPTQCGYCKSSIWGLSKQGKTCKLCGLSVHSKCELKVPADCQQSTEDHSAPISRTSTLKAQSSRKNALGPSSVVVPSASSFVQSVSEESSYEESYPTAQVLFDFVPTSEFELEVSEGTSVHVLEPDDGSGWVKVIDSNDNSGLVPATYLKAESPKESSTAQGAERQVRAIYPYDARGPDELSLKEGEVLRLSSGPAGGENYGDGWWEGYDSQGRKGIFPSNYVEMA